MNDGAGHVNRFGGTASAWGVVQARDVHGGIHLHQPPPPTSAVVPRQLLAADRHFVNRSRELASLTRLVAGSGEVARAAPVAAITGTAGIGKTSLALRWAHRVRQRFPDGELYANLRGYAAEAPVPAERVLGRFLEDLGVPAARVPAGGEHREAMYRSLLADRRMLVFLDDAAGSAQVRPLLPGGGGCVAVVTSRDALSGLVAQQGALRLHLGTLSAADAVALLRAAMVEYRRRDRRTDLAELAGLCARLPLALRIAAERAAGRPAESLAELIDDLRGGGPLWSVLTTEVEEGPDAMKSVFEWSYRALPPPAAWLFRALGLHPGNEFGLPAVVGLSGLTPSQARARLNRLVGAHLLERRPAGRYEFHDLLRAYAADRVRREESEPERRMMLGRCLAWYLHTADAAQRAVAPFDSYRLDDHVPAPAGVLRFDDYDAAFQWYRTESANLVSAARVALGADMPEIAWRLAVVLRAVYMHHNAFEDWTTTARIGVEAASRAGDPAGEAEALESLGKAAFQALRLDEAERFHRGALELRRRLGDRRGQAVSVNALGLLGLRRRRLEEARERFADSAVIFERLRDRRWTAIVRGNLAESLCELGRSEDALGILRRVLVDFREVGDRGGEGNALFLVSRACRTSGDVASAREAIGRALAIAANERNQVWRGHWLVEAARVAGCRGRAEEMLSLCRESAHLQRRLGDTAREAVALDGAGEACQALGRFEEAVAFHRHSVALLQELDAAWRLARALEHLAAALDRLGDPAPSRVARQEALRVLQRFDDPPAVVLARQVAHRLEDT